MRENLAHCYGAKFPIAYCWTSPVPFPFTPYTLRVWGIFYALVPCDPAPWLIALDAASAWPSPAGPCVCPFLHGSIALAYRLRIGPGLWRTFPL